MNNENLKNNVLKAGLSVGVLLSIFLLALSIKEFKSIGYVGKDLSSINTISVSGTGDATSIPDIATFSFSVTETAKTVADAQSQATTKINTALKALKDNGVADKDIKTTSYSINPHYDYSNGPCTVGGICQPGKSVLTGYDVSQSIEVKIRDLTKAGDLFATIGSLDVQNVNGLTFSIDNIDAVKDQARNLAIANAQEKAKTLASQLGVSLVRITNFYDQNEVPPFMGTDSGIVSPMMMKASAVAPQVPTGEQKITSNVTITYEIR